MRQLYKNWGDKLSDPQGKRIYMQKIFYVSRNEDKAHEGKAPDMDRFQRVEKLNGLLAAGWAIKEMKTENNSTFFVLEKAD